MSRYLKYFNINNDSCFYKHEMVAELINRMWNQRWRCPTNTCFLKHFLVQPSGSTFSPLVNGHPLEANKICQPLFGNSPREFNFFMKSQTFNFGHPPGAANNAQQVAEDSLIVFEPTVAKAINSFPSGLSGGPSILVPQLFKNFIAKSNGPIGNERPPRS